MIYSARRFMLAALLFITLPIKQATAQDFGDAVGRGASVTPAAGGYNITLP